MKWDPEEEIKITRWQLIQLTFASLALGAALGLFNQIVSFAVVGVAILIFALPLISKVILPKKEEEP